MWNRHFRASLPCPALPAMAVNKSTTRWMLLQTSVTNYSAYLFNNIPFLICCWLRRLGLSRTYCDNGSSALHADFTVTTFSPQVRRVHVYVSGNICARRPISAGSAVSPYPCPHSQGLERLVHFSLCRDFKRGASRRIPRSFHRIPATKNPHFPKGVTSPSSTSQVQKCTLDFPFRRRRR